MAALRRIAAWSPSRAPGRARSRGCKQARGHRDEVKGGTRRSAPRRTDRDRHEGGSHSRPGRTVRPKGEVARGWRLRSGLIAQGRVGNSAGPSALLASCSKGGDPLAGRDRGGRADEAMREVLRRAGGLTPSRLRRPVRPSAVPPRRGASARRLRAPARVSEWWARRTGVSDTGRGRRRGAAGRQTRQLGLGQQPRRTGKTRVVRRVLRLLLDGAAPRASFA